MRGLKIPQQYFVLKGLGGAYAQGGHICGTLWYMYVCVRPRELYVSQLEGCMHTLDSIYVCMCIQHGRCHIFRVHHQVALSQSSALMCFINTSASMKLYSCMTSHPQQLSATTRESNLMMHLKYMMEYSISIQDCHMVYMSVVLESRQTVDALHT